MAEHIRMGGRPQDGRPGSLGQLIHVAVRRAIEVAVDVELTAALGAPRYERCGSRCGYRNGTKPRTLTGPTGPLALTVPRATLFPGPGHAGMALDPAASLSAPAPRGQRGCGRHLPRRREHPAPPGRSQPLAPSPPSGARGGSAPELIVVTRDGAGELRSASWALRPTEDPGRAESAPRQLARGVAGAVDVGPAPLQWLLLLLGVVRVH